MCGDIHEARPQLPELRQLSELHRRNLSKQADVKNCRQLILDNRCAGGREPATEGGLLRECGHLLLEYGMSVLAMVVA